MTDPLVLTPPPRIGAPNTLESRALFRVRCASLRGPHAATASTAPMVWVTGADGGLIVYPESKKLAVLAAERARRAQAGGRSR